MTDTATTTSADKLVRLAGVLSRIPVSRSAWYEGVKTGIFPKPIKFGRAVLWRQSDIDRLIAELTPSEYGGQHDRL